MIIWKTLNTIISELLFCDLSTFRTRRFNCSPAELVYGEILRLTQEFVNREQQFVHQSEFAAKLKEHFKHIQLTQTCNHPENSFADKHLWTCKRVLIRKDHAKLPLELRYSGHFEIVTRKTKFFELLIDGKLKNYFC